MCIEKNLDYEVKNYWRYCILWHYNGMWHKTGHKMAKRKSLRLHNAYLTLISYQLHINFTLTSYLFTLTLCLSQTRMTLIWRSFHAYSRLLYCWSLDAHLTLTSILLDSHLSCTWLHIFGSYLVHIWYSFTLIYWK